MIKNISIAVICLTLGLLLSKFIFLEENNNDKNITYCENQTKNLKKCPKNLGNVFLPRTYQARSIYISYSDNLSHLKFLDLILKKVKTVTPLPTVNVLIARQDVPNAREYFQNRYKNENRSFLNYIPTPSNETVWQQDYYELLFNTQSGSTSIVDLPYTDREGEEIPSALSLYCKKDLIEQAKEFSKDYPPGNGDYGGNIEAMSEKIVTVGNNITTETLSQIKKLTSQEFVGINVEWLVTGHVDELFSLVPHKKNAGPCDQTLLYSSPAKAFELLENVNGIKIPVPFFGKEPFDDGKRWPDFEKCIMDQKNQTSLCLSFKEANSSYQKIQEENLELIQNAFKKFHGCELKTLAFPQLFSPEKINRAFYGSNEDFAVAFNSNSVNNIFFNPVLFLPKQRISVFQNYIEKSLKPFNFDVNFIGGEFVHALSGGIHCATNISYACTP